MKRVLFVCLGNICRSTMAEAVMRHKVKEAGLTGDILVDSAGTADYHIGERPHKGTREKLEKLEISCEGILGRQITKEDLDSFDYIIGMDENNMRDLQRLSTPQNKDKLYLLSDFVPDCRWKSGRAVPDPWYTGNFEETFDLVEEGCEHLLAALERALDAKD